MHWSGVLRKNGPQPKTTQLSLSQILLVPPGKPELGRVGLPGVGRIRLVFFPLRVRSVSVRLMGRWVITSAPEPHNSVSDTPLVHLNFYTLGPGSLLPVHELCTGSQGVWRMELLHSPRLMFFVSSKLPSLLGSQNPC